MNRLSIAIPVYNGSNYISEAIESVLNQDCTDFELVVSDGGSTDNTLEIVERYAQKDPRVRVLRSDNRLSMADNFNQAVRACSGEWVQLLCHDDIMLPRCVRRLHTVIETLAPTVGVVGHAPSWLFANGYYYPALRAERPIPWNEFDAVPVHATTLDDKPRFWSGREWLRAYLSGRPVDSLPDVTLAMVRKAAFNTAPGFDSRYLQCDAFFWLRLIMHWDFVYFPEVLTVTRIHSHQTTVYLRKTLTIVREYVDFWPNFMSQVRRDVDLDWWCYLRASLKPLAIAGHRLAIEIMKKNYHGTLVIMLQLRPSWWPFMPLFALRSLRILTKRDAPYRPYVPVELIYP